jgi:hypothetical protein
VARRDGAMFSVSKDELLLGICSLAWTKRSFLESLMISENDIWIRKPLTHLIHFYISDRVQESEGIRLCRRPVDRDQEPLDRKYFHPILF